MRVLPVAYLLWAAAVGGAPASIFAVMVTGGNGFLGKYVVRKLNERGTDVFVVPQNCYDPSAPLRVCLRRLEDTRRALSDANPQMVQ